MYPPDRMQCEVCRDLGPHVGHMRPADAMDWPERSRRVLMRASSFTRSISVFATLFLLLVIVFELYGIVEINGPVCLVHIVSIISNSKVA